MVSANGCVAAIYIIQLSRRIEPDGRSVVTEGQPQASLSHGTHHSARRLMDARYPLSQYPPDKTNIGFTRCD